jgi:glycosyltransferase involved in cell wall biosynthesis
MIPGQVQRLTPLSHFCSEPNLSKLSVILITKNEASNIADCLRSVSFADEIIVLDSGSTDSTVSIARALGATVHQTADWPGFGIQKNRALALASHPWILSIDADERVPQGLEAEIMEIVRGDRAEIGWQIPRMTQFCGQWIRHCGWSPDYVLRLFRRGAGHFSDDLVHERLILEGGAVGQLATRLLHYSFPTPTHYIRKLEQYSQAWALQRHREGRRAGVLRATLAAMAAFLRSYVFQRGFLDGSMGFAVCALQAQGAFGKYFALYCMNRLEADGPTTDAEGHPKP